MTTESAEPAPSSPRRGGRPSRRDQIVLAAAEAFATSGFHNTSLQAIATTLDMTPAGILHHFKLKENLLTAVLHHRDQQGSTLGEGDFFAQLLRVVSRNADEPGLTSLFAILSAESVTQDHPAQAWFRDRYVTVRGEAEDAFAAAVGANAHLVAEEITTAARALVATMDGLQIQWLLDPAGQPMPPALELTITALSEHLRRLADQRAAD